MDVLIRRINFQEGCDYKLIVVKSDGKVWSLDKENSVFYESVTFSDDVHLRLIDADKLKSSVIVQCKIASELGQMLKLEGMKECSDMLMAGVCREVDNADTVLEFGNK